ncbi:LAQU0S05e07140g1_1 [Lachancea quebecensis]|uniref:LAQU0S05e07140g1_1 n=1 Tax=Lachancea quebecensis TaxID=1654605 RepID=A0A0P1KS17_9SACH|nr:LAQU0S05e07140g1_1 [Lachancea quebecensis]
MLPLDDSRLQIRAGPSAGLGVAINSTPKSGAAAPYTDMNSPHVNPADGSPFLRSRVHVHVTCADGYFFIIDVAVIVVGVLLLLLLPGARQRPRGGAYQAISGPRNGRVRSSSSNSSSGALCRLVSLCAVAGPRGLDGRREVARSRDNARGTGTSLRVRDTRSAARL